MSKICCQKIILHDRNRKSLVLHIPDDSVFMTVTQSIYAKYEDGDLWFIVGKSKTYKHRTLKIFINDEDLGEDIENLKYVGSYQCMNTSYTQLLNVHVFEVIQ